MKTYLQFFKENNGIRWYVNGKLESENDDHKEYIDKEIISNIEEINDVINKTEYIGFLIETNKNIYKFVISNEDNSCEVWGCITSEDNFDEFIGSELMSIENPKVWNNASDLDELKVNMKDIKNDETFAVFINVYTSNGLLQFVVHNTHNGYYGHGVFFIKNDIIEKRFVI